MPVRRTAPTHDAASGHDDDPLQHGATELLQGSRRQRKQVESLRKERKKSRRAEAVATNAEDELKEHSRPAMQRKVDSSSDASTSSLRLMILGQTGRQTGCDLAMRSAKSAFLI